MNQLSSVGTNPVTSVPIQPGLLDRNQNQAGLTSTINTTTAHTSRNDTQDLIALQRDNFPAYTKEMQTRLAPEDRTNPFAYSLGADVPIEIKRQVFAEWQSEQNAPNVEIGSLSGSNATFDETKGRNGTININGDLLTPSGTRTGQMEAFAAWGHMEEVGHWGDMRAQQLMGRPGADAIGDEGARFAYMSLPGLVEGRNPQTMLADYSIKASNGTEKNFKVDTVILKALAAEKLASGSFATENRIGGRENFGPEGHYQTTYITAYNVAVSMEFGKAEADTIANKMALGSQLPDMLAHYDATSQFWNVTTSKFGEHPTFSGVEQQHLENVYEGLHALPRGSDATIEWRDNERAETATFIKQSIADGKFVEAGVAIHRFADLHAHVKTSGIPYSGNLGHTTGGHSVDYLYTQNTAKEAQAWNKSTEYQQALAGVIAEGVDRYKQGLGFNSSPEETKKAADIAVSTWRNIYDGALAEGAKQLHYHSDHAPPSGANAQDTTETIFRTRASEAIINIQKNSGNSSDFLPISQMEVGGGYTASPVDQSALDTVMKQFQSQ